MAKEKAADHFEASHAIAKARLLKANNVQRRRFEKMAEDAIEKARRDTRDVNHEHRTIVMQSVVRKHLGDDYDRLVGIREQILRLKREIVEYRTAAEAAERRARAAGISFGCCGLGYFTNPSIPTPDDGSCSTVVGDPHLQSLGLTECRTKAPWVEYEGKVLELSLDEDTVEQDGDDLRAAIWQLTTTDEIVAAINAFKEKYSD